MITMNYENKTGPLQPVGSISRVETERVIEAPPPISGTFDLLYEGHLISGIPADVEPFDLQQR